MGGVCAEATGTRRFCFLGGREAPGKAFVAYLSETLCLGVLKYYVSIQVHTQIDFDVLRIWMQNSAVCSLSLIDKATVHLILLQEVL